MVRESAGTDSLNTLGGYGTKVSMTTSYTVAGMTCGHCVSSVREEVAEVAGVTAVEVDLATGTVTVASDGPVEDAAIRTAIEEAGYQLAGQ